MLYLFSFNSLILIRNRKLDEIAAKQRQREEEAEARLAAKKAGGLPDRSAPRGQASEAAQSSGGPPRLNLAGAKPSWREREAMKASGQSAPSESAPAAPSTSAAPESDAPKRSGYVPPALRNRGAEGSPSSGWREREGSGRGAGRNESPANAGSSRYEAPSRGRFSDTGDKGKTQSPATRGQYVPPGRREGREGRETEGESAPPPPAQGSSDGKYRPGAFKRNQQG